MLCHTKQCCVFMSHLVFRLPLAHLWRSLYFVLRAAMEIATATTTTKTPQMYARIELNVIPSPHIWLLIAYSAKRLYFEILFSSKHWNKNENTYYIESIWLICWYIQWFQSTFIIIIRTEQRSRRIYLIPSVCSCFPFACVFLHYILYPSCSYVVDDLGFISSLSYPHRTFGIR